MCGGETPYENEPPTLSTDRTCSGSPELATEVDVVYVGDALQVSLLGGGGRLRLCERTLTGGIPYRLSGNRQRSDVPWRAITWLSMILTRVQIAMRIQPNARAYSAWTSPWPWPTTTSWSRWQTLAASHSRLG